MAIGTLPARAAHARLPWRARVREMLDRERILGPLFITPALILIAVLVAYPFCMALYFALSNSFIGRPSQFGPGAVMRSSAMPLQFTTL